MAYSKQVWDQLKSKACEQLMAALEKDGFLYDGKRGATMGYRHPDGRHVVIHYHPKKCYGAGALQGIIEAAGWKEDDLRRLKLVK